MAAPPPAPHPNAALVRRLFEAFRAGDAATIRAVMADDIVWHFPGRRGRLAGSHRGPDAVFAFLLQVQQLTGGTFRLELVDVLASDRGAVALFRGRAEREGRTLDNPTCLCLRIAESRIVEVHEFVWDLYGVDDFWA